MSTIKYIGRKTDFKGKTLWEIVGNLKNFGVGRLVIRNMFQRYPEPSYMKILKVEALPNPDKEDTLRKVKVTVEKTFRGRTLPKSIEICSASYKPDYQLIPKIREHEFCKPMTSPVEKILPSKIEFPPLFREFITEESGVPNPLMELRFTEQREKLCRVAKEGEIPTIEIGMSLGKPVSPKLFQNLTL